MKHQPVWATQIQPEPFPALQNDIHVDVAIVGGGITGLTTAYCLMREGKKVAILESRKIGAGSTGYSTGNLYATVGGWGLHKIKSKFNADVMKRVVESRGRAVDFIQEIIEHYNIDCDFTRASWNLFTEDGSTQSYVEKEKEAAIECGLPVSDAVPYPRNIKFGFSVADQAQFNPYKYVTELSKGLAADGCQIYEQTHVNDVTEGDECTVKTNHGNVTAAHVVMATHSPLGIYMLHTLMETYREYAVAVTLNGEYPQAGIFWDLQETEHYSMRTYDTTEGKYLMVLGQMHKVGHKENNHECLRTLEVFLRQRFDVASVGFVWSAQQFQPADGIPYIGLTPANKKIYVATGFAADGLVYGTLSAKINSDLICGKENQWAKMYDASRLTPVASAKQFLTENVSVVRDLVKDYISGTDAHIFSDIAMGEGKIMNVNGSKKAVYRDDTNALHILSAKCTHMGCIVHFNEVEKSWDCPCHGSRFSIDGEVLDGPAWTPLEKAEFKEKG